MDNTKLEARNYWHIQDETTVARGSWQTVAGCGSSTQAIYEMKRARLRKQRLFAGMVLSRHQK
jgi:hypothetical protein